MLAFGVPLSMKTVALGGMESVTRAAIARLAATVVSERWTKMGSPFVAFVWTLDNHRRTAGVTFDRSGAKSDGMPFRCQFPENASQRCPVNLISAAEFSRTELIISPEDSSEMSCVGITEIHRDIGN